MTDYINKSILLFPNQKKNGKSPDYRGSINDENRAKVADVIYYIRKPKAGGYYFAGYVLMEFIDPVKTNIIIHSNNTSPDGNKPNITGKIDIAGKNYEIALWEKTDKNGKQYYSGKISMPKLDR
jgi:hypothetical protein